MFGGDGRNYIFGVDILEEMEVWMRLIMFFSYDYLWMMVELFESILERFILDENDLVFVSFIVDFNVNLNSVCGIEDRDRGDVNSVVIEIIYFKVVENFVVEDNVNLDYLFFLFFVEEVVMMRNVDNDIVFLEIELVIVDLISFYDESDDE